MISSILGKEPPPAKKSEPVGEPDEYDALASGLIKASQAGDHKRLAGLLRAARLLRGEDSE